MKTDVRMPRIVPRTEAPDEQMTQMVSQAVRRAKEGDHEAVGFLYARYADNVFGYVRSILHDSHDAEDVTQQVFAKLTHVIGKYEERDGPFFAWVMRVGHARGPQSRCPPPAPPAHDPGRGGEDDDRGRCGPGQRPPAERGSPRGAFAAAQGPDQREVVRLRHVAGFSPPEIAELTGRSEELIHGLRHCGRRALAAGLVQHGIAPTTTGARSSRRDAGGQGAQAREA
jgi:RNA polymerase sigma-70 factor (ECF subfamily)